jgi:hypothetical protein
MDSEGPWDYFLGGGDVAVSVSAIAVGVLHFAPSLAQGLPYSSTVVDLLFVYLVLNGLGVAIPVGWARWTGRKGAGLCPQCNTRLEVKSKFVCPHCGELEFKKDK